MKCSVVSLLLLAVVASPMRAETPPRASVKAPDARVLLDVAFPCCRFVVKQGRTLVYDPPAEPQRGRERAGPASHPKPAPGTLTNTLTPAPLEPQSVSDPPSPPPYFTITTGRFFLTIEAGMGNYEISIELLMP